MAKNLKLLLVENVDALGIVGDVVNVRTGYARNFLLPRGLATKPSDELIKSLSAKRVEAQKQVAEQRSSRESLISKLKGVEITLVKSCNDQGILYGAITQQEVANSLNEQGYAIKPRDVRLPSVIKRIDNYEVHIKLDSDLDATVKLHVKADRELDIEKAKEEAAAQDEQVVVVKKRKDAIDLAAEDEAAKKATKGTWGKAATSTEAAPAAAETKADKKPKAEKADKKADKKGDKPEKKAKK